MRRCRPQADPDRSRSHRAGKCRPRRGVAAAGARARHSGTSPSATVFARRDASSKAGGGRRSMRRLSSGGSASSADWKPATTSRSHRATMERCCGVSTRRARRPDWMRSGCCRRACARRRPLDAPGGIRLGASFTLDPHRACLGLAAAARSRGGTFFERSRVSKVRAGAKQVEIVVDGGLVRAANRHRVHRHRHERVQAAAASLQTARAVLRDDRAGAGGDSEAARCVRTSRSATRHRRDIRFAGRATVGCS